MVHLGILIFFSCEGDLFHMDIWSSSLEVHTCLATTMNTADQDQQDESQPADLMGGEGQVPPTVSCMYH